MLSKHCETLKLPSHPLPTKKEVDKAFRKLATMQHSDKSGDRDGFQKLQEAKQALYQSLDELEKQNQTLDQMINAHQDMLQNEIDTLIEYENDRAQHTTKLAKLENESVHINNQIEHFSIVRQQIREHISLQERNFDSQTLDAFSRCYDKMLKADKKASDFFRQNFYQRMRNKVESSVDLIQALKQKAQAKPNSRTGNAWRAIEIDAIFKVEKTNFEQAVMKSEQQRQDLIAAEIALQSRLDDIIRERHNIQQFGTIFAQQSERVTQLRNQLVKMKVDKVVAFKKIYTALRQGQRFLLYDTDFLVEHAELTPIQLFEILVKHNPPESESRVKKAFQLAGLHGQKCGSDNNILFTEIYNWSASTIQLLGIFAIDKKIPLISVKQITTERHRNSRMNYIYMALNKS